MPASIASCSLGGQQCAPLVRHAPTQRLPVTADSKGGSTCLTITNQENERTVRSLNLPGIGKTVIFAPLTKAEREQLAKTGQIQTVPVIAAKK